MSTRLVKILITPVYIIEDQEGNITGDILPKEPIVVFAADVKKVHDILDEFQQKVTDATAPKS